MKAKDLIERLQHYPEMWVKIAETGKHKDNAPTMKIVDVDISKLFDVEEEVFVIWIEPNPDTIIKPIDYSWSSEDYPI